jgi:hypothetical protein
MGWSGCLQLQTNSRYVFVRRAVQCCAVLFIPFGMMAPALTIFFVDPLSSNLELFFSLFVAHFFALTGSCPYSDATTTKPLDSQNLLNF